MDLSLAARILAARRDSASALVLRAGLVGLRAALLDALEPARDDGDPAAAQIRELIGEIDAALATPAPRTGSGQPDRPQAPADGRSGRLRELAAGLAVDPAARRLLDEGTLAVLAAPDASGAAADEALWSVFHLRLLRLPAHDADGWRRRASALADTSPAAARWTTLPGHVETVLIPPYSPGGPALRTSPNARPDPQAVAEFHGAQEQDAVLAALAGLAMCVLGVAEHDDSLYLCLESIKYLGAERLNERLAARYREELQVRMNEYGGAGSDSIARFQALVSFDEAVASLVHSPPAAPDSWWGSLGAGSRALLTEQVRALRSAGHDVEAVPLTLRYRDVRAKTSGNDVGGSDRGSAPGDVLACLRVWARVETRQLPGRVLYQLSRDEGGAL